MAEKTAPEAVWALIQSFQATNQAVTESFVTAQESNRKLAESFFQDGMAVLKSNQVAAEKLLAVQQSNRKIAERFFQDGMQLLKTNEEAAESLVAAQEDNVRYAQRFFTDGMQILERQAESMRMLMQQLEQQIKKQQEALQMLVQGSVDNYVDVLRSPLSYYQQTLDAAETLTRQGLEQFQKATQQLQGNADKVHER